MKKIFKRSKEKYTPELPRWVEVSYIGSFLITLLFSEGFIHGFFSVAPIFLILRITFARLVRGDLGSTVVCLSQLAEFVGMKSFNIISTSIPSVQA